MSQQDTQDAVEEVVVDVNYEEFTVYFVTHSHCLEDEHDDLRPDRAKEVLDMMAENDSDVLYMEAEDLAARFSHCIRFNPSIDDLVSLNDAGVQFLEALEQLEGAGEELKNQILFLLKRVQEDEAFNGYLDY